MPPDHALVFTHAETCHALSTGMISNSPFFTARNLTAHFTAQREAAFRGFYEMGRHLYQVVGPVSVPGSQHNVIWAGICTR